MTWMVLCLVGAMAVGFFGIAYFAAHPDQAAPVRANRETVFITLSQVLFNPIRSGSEFPSNWARLFHDG